MSKFEKCPSSKNVQNFQTEKIKMNIFKNYLLDIIMCELKHMIRFIYNWVRFSSSSWVEYYYLYYNDLVRETYTILLNSVNSY